MTTVTERALQKLL